MRLLFGGPNLPEGKHTWYDHINPDGSYGGQIDVHPGMVLDADRVGKYVGMTEATVTTKYDDDGVTIESGDPPKPVLVPNAKYYVETGRATLIE
jgi:hypothetical protein